MDFVSSERNQKLRELELGRRPRANRSTFNVLPCAFFAKGSSASYEQKSSSCFSLIDFTIRFEAPLREDLERSPRLAASAAQGRHLLFLGFCGHITPAGDD
jgi:hypothetical protein